MFRHSLAGIFLLFILGVPVSAQDENLQSTVDYKVNKMKTELKLTEIQSVAIRPVIKDYLSKRQALMQEMAGQGIIDHVSVKGTLKALKEDEHQKLSKILSEDQLKKWINKENLMATINPDSVDSTVDEGTTLTASGANFKF